MVQAPFFSLDNAHISELVDGIGLDTLVLEQEMMQHNGGVDLSEIDIRDLYGGEPYELFVPRFFIRYNEPSAEGILKITDKHPDIKSPCSVSLTSLEELSEHMSVGYQVAHFNYILKKKHDESFPLRDCGPSSMSIVLSLIEFGYPNAAYAFSTKYDHAYVLLPFVFEEEDVNGTIIIDPTFDQLWNHTNVRSAVFIKLGLEWEYRTERGNGGNLFPNVVCSIDTLRKKPNDIVSTKHYHHGGKQYFEKAFSNPILIRGS